MNKIERLIGESIFNMKTEEELIWERYLLFEMPMYIPEYPYDPKDPEEQALMYRETMETMKLVKKFEGFDVYSDGVDYNILDGEQVVSEISLGDLKNGSAQMISIWQNKEYRGLLRRFFIKEIIPKFTSIYGDENLSERGFNFWKQLVSELGDKINYGIYDVRENELIILNDMDEMKKYHQEGEEYKNFLFYLEHK